MPTDFLEKTLEDIIFENRHRIHERGFPSFFKNAQRQYRLPSGKIIDILTWEVRGDVLHAKVIELKKDNNGESAFWQAIDYCGELFMAVFHEFTNIYIQPIICTNYLSNNIENLMYIRSNVVAVSYKYEYGGIAFIKEVWGEDSIEEFNQKRRIGDTRPRPGHDNLAAADYLRNFDLQQRDGGE